MGEGPAAQILAALSSRGELHGPHDEAGRILGPPSHAQRQ